MRVCIRNFWKGIRFIPLGLVCAAGLSMETENPDPFCTEMNVWCSAKFLPKVSNFSPFCTAFLVARGNQSPTNLPGKMESAEAEIHFPLPWRVHKQVLKKKYINAMLFL